MKKNTILIILFFASAYISIYAQEDIQIGSPYDTRPSSAGSLFDYSDPNSINIKVQLWGYVKLAGVYIIPAGTSLNELLSLAGGPTEDATLTDIRVIKLKENSPTIMNKYDYNELVWEDKITTQIKYVILDAGDMIVVPGEPRYFVREDIAFYLGVLTALASIAALVISVISLTN